MYRSAIVYIRRHKSTGLQEDLDALETFKSALKALEGRWRVAGNLPSECHRRHVSLILPGSYFELITARSITGIL